MAPLAKYAREYVLTVVEVHEVGKVMHLYPANRSLLLHRFLELLKLDGLFFQHRVTIHADAGRWDSCVSARARGIMAVKARNLVIARMYFV